MNLQHAGRRLRSRLQPAQRLVPVDRPVAGPQVGVLVSLVVVEMRGANVRVQLRESRRHAIAQMRMTHVEAHANVSKMPCGKNLHQMRGPRHVALQILHQQLHPQRARKGAQMFETR